jgi:RHS repeat-associated protein
VETMATSASTLTTPGQRTLLVLHDALGSAGIVLDRETGELVEAVTYTAYGQTESDLRPERFGSNREDERFTGKEEDVEIGLVYFGKRYLVPAMARWASADPLAVHAPGEADLNLYAYVHGRVYVAVDPLGLQEASPADDKELFAKLDTLVSSGRIRGADSEAQRQLVAFSKAGMFFARNSDSTEHTLFVVDRRIVQGLVALGERSTRAMPTSIMSLGRYASGPETEAAFGSPHGWKGRSLGQVATVYALDITEFGGESIRLRNEAGSASFPWNQRWASAMKMVAGILRSVPDGQYGLGVPRPVGRGGFAPEWDGFFDVTDKSQVCQSPGNSVGKTVVAKMHAGGREMVREALATNPGVKLGPAYPDAPDHIHLAVDPLPWKSK